MTKAQIARIAKEMNIEIVKAAKNMVEIAPVLDEDGYVEDELTEKNKNAVVSALVKKSGFGWEGYRSGYGSWVFRLDENCHA